MLQIGVEVCLNYLLFLWPAPMLGLCVLEKHIILNYLFFRDSSAGWLTLQWRGSHVALQALSSLNMRPLWIPYGSGTIFCGPDSHEWNTSLGITAGGVCTLMLTDTSSRWVTCTEQSAGTWLCSAFVPCCRVVIFPFKCQWGEQSTEHSTGHKSI